MKKLISLAAALAMAATLPLTVAAASGSATLTSAPKTQEIPVKAQYSGSVDTPEVISADIAWGDMEFTYAAGGSMDWKPADHTYDNNSTAHWEPKGNTVTITNHSNVAIKAKATYAAKTGYEAITGSFSYDKTPAEGYVTLAKGEVDQYAQADKVTATLTLTGALDSSKTALTDIGSITVEIKK